MFFSRFTYIKLTNTCLFNIDRDAVEKRLSILQEQGYVYSNTVNGNNST